MMKYDPGIFDRMKNEHLDAMNKAEIDILSSCGVYFWYSARQQVQDYKDSRHVGLNTLNAKAYLLMNIYGQDISRSWTCNKLQPEESANI